MQPEEIKALLILKKVTITMIAKDCGVSVPTVSQVINYRAKSARIETAIANKLGKTREEVFSLKQSLTKTA